MSAQVMSAQTNGVSPTPPPKTIAKSRGQLKKLKQKQKKLAGLTNGTHKEEVRTSNLIYNSDAPLTSIWTLCRGVPFTCSLKHPNLRNPLYL